VRLYLGNLRTKINIMQRPVSVTIFGVLNIVFAVLGILGTLGSLALFMPAMANSGNPIIKLIHDNPAYAAWLKVSIVFGLAGCVASLAAGIGLLKLLPWARTLSIVYAIYAIVMNIVGSVANYHFVVQPMLAQAHSSSGPDAAGAMGGAIGGMLGGCFGMIYPILLLVFMLKADVKDAFKRPPPLPGN
jgi:hypothetical protein